MKRLMVLLSLPIILVFSGFVLAGNGTPEESLTKLMEGNQRFASGSLAQKDLSEAKRKELAERQKPFAIVLTCSDSTVPPEIIFDQALGDIFVIRVEGNVVDPIILGSIEYALEHLGTPLLFVLGHENCGAVASALEMKKKPLGNNGSILTKIMPAVRAARKKDGTKDEVLEAAIKENIKNTRKDILKRSSIVRHFVREGKLKIVAGEYSLETGKVVITELVVSPHKS